MKSILSKCSIGVLIVSLLFGVIPQSWAAEDEAGAPATVAPGDGRSAEADLNAWETEGSEPETVPKKPIFSDGPELVPPDGSEEIHHDRSSRTYLLEDDTYLTRIFDEPITFGDGRKEQDVDNTLVFDGEVYRNRANAYTVDLPAEGKGITIRNKGRSLEILPQFGTLKNGVISENAIRYNDVSDGVDLQYAAFGSGVKEDIILNRPVADPVFSYELKSGGVRFEEEDNVIVGRADAEEDAAFTIAAPEMRDASGAISQSVALSLENADGTAIMTVRPDAAWLNAPERAYPVVVDPTHKLTNDNLLSGVVQAFEGPASGPDREHHITYLYAGLEDGSLIATMQGGVPIRYGESWSFIQIRDIAPYITGLPENAILSASLMAWKYSGLPSPERYVDAKMIAAGWSGDGRHTWNNRPFGGNLTDFGNGQDVSGDKKWVQWDITEMFREWKRDPASNRGVMLTPRDEAQPAVCFSGTGNVNGNEALYFELHWTVPNAVDEDLPLDAPNVNLRPLTHKNGTGLQNVTGVFADGLVRPTLNVDYRLNTGDCGVYENADYGRIFPDSDLFAGTIPFTLGYYGMYESNWQSKLFRDFATDTIYHVRATASAGEETTPEGKSDDFIIYRFRDQDTLPYVANHYGVTRDQIVRDNRSGDDLAMPGNTFFIRNPTRNATVPYTRPDNLTLEQKRAIIYANMGRSQTSEFDLEPVNMNTGNFLLESVDAQNAEYTGDFSLTRTYNSIGPKTAGAFGRGWTFEYQQTLVGREDGGMTYRAGDGRQLVFPAAGGGWSSPTGYSLTLTKIAAADPHDVRYEIRDADGNISRFDSYGILETITDRRGLVTSVRHDASYNLTGVTTGSGRHYAFSVNAGGQIAQVVMPDGHTLRYEYNADGCLTAFVNADGDRVTYAYDANGLMIEWKDGNGHSAARNEYDAEGRVIRQTDADGGVSQLRYEDGKTTLIDAENREKVYAYDALFRTVRIGGADADVSKSWDAENRPASVTEKTGLTTSYVHDANGNVTKEIRSDGAYREISYHPPTNMPERIREFDGTVTEHSLDGYGNPVRTELPDGSETAYVYDMYGRTLSVTDGAGNTTSFAYSGLERMEMTDANGGTTICHYDAMGRLINEVDALGVEHRTMYSPNGKQIGIWQTGGISEEYGFDGAGNCTEVISNGNKRTFVYDVRNRIVRTIDPPGGTVVFSYDRTGNKLSQTDAAGNTTLYAYDAVGRLTKETDALGAVTEYAYDAAGRLTKETDKTGNVTVRTYGGTLGMLTEETSPSGTTSYAYDGMGRMIRRTDPDGSEEVYAYDVAGRQTMRSEPGGLITEYVYDANGRVTETRDNAGRVAKSEYDGNGNLIRFTDPLNRVTAYRYDAANRLISETRPGGLVTEYVHDAAGNVVSTTNPAGETEHFEYDAGGRMTRSVDANGFATEYRYNAADGMVARIDALGGTKTYEYNANGLPIAETGELTQRSELAYDALNRPAKIVDPNGGAATIEYDPNGNIAKVTDAGGGEKTMRYDAAGRVVKTFCPEGLEIAYEYDAAGRVVREWDNAGNEMRYAYNAAGKVTQKTDALHRTAVYAYDPAGNVTETIDFNGNRTVYVYDLASQLISTTGGDGRTMTFAYDGAGLLIRRTDADGRSSRYEYDKAGRLRKTVDPAGRITENAYDATGNPTKTIEPGGSVSAWVYDALGRTVAETDAAGNETLYAYDASGRQVRRIEPNGAVTEYEYDAAGNVTGTIDAYGNVSETRYDSLNRVIAERSPSGAETQYEYDGQGRKIREIGALGAIVTYAYSRDGNLLTQTEPNGLQTSYTYDAVGRVTRIADSTGVFRDTEYDAYGNVTGETDQNGARISYRYDGMHRMIETAGPNGAVTSYSYDARGNLVNEHFPTGGEVSYTYDALDRLLTGKKSLNAAVEYTYDGAGRVVRTKQKDRITQTTYDGNGNTLSERNALGAAVSRIYDAAGLPISETDRNGNTSLTEYDLLGRVTKTTDAMGGTQTYAYDAEGNIIRRIDELGRVTQFSHDKLGRLTALADPLGRTASYVYDDMGNMIRKTLGGRSTAYTYDSHGNLTEIVSPGGRIEQFIYDISSRLETTVKPDGAAIDYDYDKLNALLKKDYGDAQEAVTYGYDNEGRRLTMDDAGGRTSYGYDEAGRLISVTDASGRSLAYGYDEYGRMSEVSYPDGRTVRYEYDLADRLVKVIVNKQRSSASDVFRAGEEATLYTYDGNGNALTCRRPDGTETSYVYDALNRLTLLENTRDGALLSSFAYGYDATGRIVSERAEQDGCKIEKSFRYDAAGQLAGCRETGGGHTTVTTYAYSENGNRTATVEGETSRRILYEYDADGRLVRECDENTKEQVEYDYDENGNLTEKDAGGIRTTYAYDIENRLRAVREGGALLMAASYDGDGNRIFQMHRTLIPFPATETADRAGEDTPIGLSDASAPLEERDAWSENEDETSGNVYSRYERIYADPGDSIFFFGFGQGIVQFFCALNTSLMAQLSDRFTDAWEAVVGAYEEVLLSEATEPYADGDVAAMQDAGLSETEIEAILHSQPEFHASADGNGKPAKPQGGGAPVMIPASPGEGTRVDYELTYYLNDVSMENAQVAMEFGKRNETKNIYVYGLERLTAERGNGGEETYLYDGRGSVAQLFAGGGITQNLAYDPYGKVTSGADGNSLIFGYNAEEYNPVTGLQYLRARYYAPAIGAFVTEDSEIGERENLLSQNRYVYAQNDPVNNADPSGHMIGTSDYERMMEENGGINEIYNFYVGATMQNHANMADNAFYRQLSDAQATPYTDMRAISGIAQIPQSLADRYINQGVGAVYAIGAVYGCAPGALTNRALETFRQDIDASKADVNSRIDEVKRSKTDLYEAWLASRPKPEQPVTRDTVIAIAKGALKYYKGNPLKADYWGWSVAIVDPFFERDYRQGIWYSTPDADQRPFGYNNFFDLVFDAGMFVTDNIAPSFNVNHVRFKSIFTIGDSFVNIKWRIEGWKGNYANMGIGAEIGIYYNLTWSPQFIVGHYDSVFTSGMPTMSFTLYRSGEGPALFSRGPEAHFWLNGFKPGSGSIPPGTTKLKSKIVFNAPAFSREYNKALAKEFREAFRLIHTGEIRKFDVYGNIADFEWI
jgi:RHS repeat-associated protein